MTTATTPALAELTELAIVATVEVDKTARAGGDAASVVQVQARLVAAAVKAGASRSEIHDEADERFIQHIRDCQNPGYQPQLAIDGGVDRLEATLREMAAA
jgi:pentose-5-phosphate-3-epimerase